MANYTAGECDFPSTVQGWISVAIIVVFILALLSLQFFIVAVNVIHWLKGGSMTGVDKIITAIGITRFISSVAFPLHFLSNSCSAELGATFFLLNSFIGVSSGFSSIWLSALLSTFYCLMIPTFNNVFFLRLKTIISQRVVCLIISSVLLGFGYTLTLSLWIPYARNGILSYSEIIHDHYKFQILFTFNCLWNIFPVVMFFVSSVLLVFCLGFHIRQMKNHGNVLSSTDTYHKMIMFTVASFLTCVLCSIVNITERYAMELFGIVWMYVFWNIFPVLHCISLIYATTKLRNEFFRIVHWGTDLLFWRKASEPDSREKMEVTRL